MCIKRLLIDTSSIVDRFWKPKRQREAHLAPYFGGFVCFYVIVLARASHGIGQYWDWSFPYFHEQLGNFFGRAASSWTPANSGSPLGYSSDYFVRFVISCFRFLQPEWLLFLLLVGLFAAGSFGVFLMARRHASTPLACLFGLASFMNTALFYKYTAGHLDYLISFVTFIYLAYYLFYVYEGNRLRDAVIVGLLLGFVGTQIQFLVITPIFLLIFFLFHREKVYWRYIAIFCAIPLCMDLVWLSNFLVGAANVAATGASKQGFSGLTTSSFFSIFDFSFAEATLVTYFYNPLELLIYFLLFVLFAGLLARTKEKQVDDFILLVFLLCMIFLGTGLFESVNLGPLTTLYPMLREVGHFAPVTVLALVLLIARLLKGTILTCVCAALLVITIGMSWVAFWQYPQAVNYAMMRKELNPFESFSETHASGNAPASRILTYPFFGEYSINQLPTMSSVSLPLENAGHDSFSAYAPGEYINNDITPQDFKDSLQYELLTTHDISVLQPYNIRYIYDLSGIYQSNYNDYVPTDTYNNDLSLIKNDPHFLQELVAANPGKVRLVSDHILEITNYTPRVASSPSLFAMKTWSATDEAVNTFITSTLHKPFVYTVVRKVQAYATSLTRLFDNIGSQSSLDTTKRTISERIVTPSSDQKTQLYTNPNQYDAFYSLVDNVLTVYTRSAGTLLMNGRSLTTSSNTPKILMSTYVAGNQSYYIAVDHTVTVVKSTLNANLGPVNSGDKIQILGSSGANLIPNPSFEQGSWQPTVSDCDNYDDNPEIGMSLDTHDKTEGKQSLELSATRHDACVSTSFHLTGNAQYLLSYDYQSPNAAIASYYMSFNNSNESPAQGFQAISDTRWHRANELITSPAGVTNGRLFIYALESGQHQASINRYDNFDLVRTQTILTTTVPSTSAPFTVQTVPGDATANFSFVDPNYTYQNLIRNGSFESGLWRSDVSDCDNYDDNPEIGMSLDTHDKTEGKQSLELSATRHDACTYTSVDVAPGANYLLSFAYQGNAVSQQSGYDVSFNDPKATSDNQQLKLSDTRWHTFTTEIEAPQDASTLTLYLYAFGDEGGQSIVHYDDVKLIRLPDLDNRYYLVSAPVTPLQTPAHINFQRGSSTRRPIQVVHVTGPFVLSLSETYNSQWRLELDNSKVQGLNSWLPTAHPTAVPATDHMTLSNYANGWYVDPAQLCQHNTGGCTRNADGSYTLDLVAEFVPQRWFTVSLGLGCIAIISSLTYVVWMWRRPTAKKGVWRWRSR